jgi:hypothetical protein
MARADQRPESALHARAVYVRFLARLRLRP